MAAKPVGRSPCACGVCCPAICPPDHASVNLHTVCPGLQIAAQDQELDASYSKRLEIGLIVFATVNALLQTTTAAQPDSVLTFPAFWSTALVFGLTVLAAWGGCGLHPACALFVGTSHVSPSTWRCPPMEVLMTSSWCVWGWQVRQGFGVWAVPEALWAPPRAEGTFPTLPGWHHGLLTLA